MSADDVTDTFPESKSEAAQEADDANYQALQAAVEAAVAVIDEIQELTERSGFKHWDPIAAVKSLIEERNRLKFEMGETRAKIAIRLAQDAADKSLRPFVADLSAEVEAAVTQHDPLLSAFLLGRVDGADRLLFAFERRWEETSAIRTQETFDLACLDRLSRITKADQKLLERVETALQPSAEKKEEPVVIASVTMTSAPPTPAPPPLDVKVTFSQPTRRYLPDTRASVTRKITLRHVNRDGKNEELDIYVSVGLYDDGTPGEIFLKAAKAGDTISGFLDALGVCISIGIQYGAPLPSFIAKLKGLRFEPSGTIVNEPRSEGLNNAGSIVDAVARWIETRFLPVDPT